MVGVELSHHGGNCSFETFLRFYGLDEEPLLAIARIVHEADLGDERLPGAQGRRTRRVDPRSLPDQGRSGTLVLTNQVYDGLYEYCRRASLLEREGGSGHDPRA
jgi:hypothetical protein